MSTWKTTPRLFIEIREISDSWRIHVCASYPDASSRMTACSRVSHRGRLRMPSFSPGYSCAITLHKSRSLEGFARIATILYPSWNTFALFLLLYGDGSFNSPGISYWLSRSMEKNLSIVINHTNDPLAGIILFFKWSKDRWRIYG